MHSIDTIITTWPVHQSRVWCLQHTLHAISSHLKATSCQLRTIVSAETENVANGSKNAIAALCKDHNARLVWRDAPANLPNHLNDAYALCEADLRLYVQDDWRLMRPLDIGVDVPRILETNMAAVRYLRASNEEIKTTQGQWAELDTAAAMVIPDWPMLSHRRWLEATGPYAGSPGHNRDHEAAMARAVHAKGLRVLARAELFANPRWYYFKHIGHRTSYQP